MSFAGMAEKCIERGTRVHLRPGDQLSLLKGEHTFIVCLVEKYCMGLLTDTYSLLASVAFRSARKTKKRRIHL